MIKFQAEKFVELTSLLRFMSISFRNEKVKVNVEIREKIKEEIDKSLALLEAVGLTQSAKKAIKISKQTSYEGYDLTHYSVAIDELKERIRDELEDTYFLHLSDKEAELFDPKEPVFGETVETKFPSTSYEIDEASKCLALGRYTACVFHLMRTLEIGIGAIRQSLNIPDPIRPAERNWHLVLKKIREALEDKGRNLKSDDKAFFDEAYASLEAVRSAWRNSTMHVENKYTQDEAQHIYSVVKGFMKKIASRMDENGEPLA